MVSKGTVESENLAANLSELQKKILAALHRRSLTAQTLADELKIDTTRLYQPGGIKELMQSGSVKNARGKGRGYFRVDFPPPMS
jgi:hypothetical protein